METAETRTKSFKKGGSRRHEEETARTEINYKQGAITMWYKVLNLDEKGKKSCGKQG